MWNILPLAWRVSRHAARLRGQGRKMPGFSLKNAALDGPALRLGEIGLRTGLPDSGENWQKTAVCEPDSQVSKKSAK